MNLRHESFFFCDLKYFVCSICLAMSSFMVYSQPVIPSICIWDVAPHNAFTSLVCFENKFYCAFREGKSHVDKNGGDEGKIRVLQSSDGHVWENMALLSIEGKDLRDPSLSVTKDGRLFIALCGVEYHPGATTIFHTYVSQLRSRGGGKLRHVKTRLSREWLWKVHWIDKEAYSFSYTSGFRLMKSRKGRSFKEVRKYNLPGNPSEADFCVADNRLFVALRRDDQYKSLVGWGNLEGDIQWQESALAFYGPNLLKLSDERILLFSRCLNPVTKKRELGAYQYLEGQFEKIATFSSSGDGGYFGAVESNDTIFVSYYSSHIGNKAAIYFTKLPRNLLK